MTATEPSTLVFGATNALGHHLLERAGLVPRTVTPSVPVRVDYELTELTELGATLVPVLGALKNWSERNIEQILAARAPYAGEPEHAAWQVEAFAR